MLGVGNLQFPVVGQGSEAILSEGVKMPMGRQPINTSSMYQLQPPGPTDRQVRQEAIDSVLDLARREMIELDAVVAYADAIAAFVLGEEPEEKA